MGPITIVDRVATHWVELPWLRFLLGDLAGETVKDPRGDVVVPHAVIVTQRPDLLSQEQLAEIRRTPNVGLFVISDEWYRRPVHAYPAFSYAWRQHLLSSLRGEGVRSLPLGPACLEQVTADLALESRTPLGDRAHPVAFVGNLVTTRFAAVKALSSIGDAVVRPSRSFGMPQEEKLSAEEYMAVLRSSAFVACPMGNVHLETFRVYEALEAGAVPIVERRKRLDYFRLLLGPHPLPTVRRWSEAQAVLDVYAEATAMERLQDVTRAWWRDYKAELQRQVRADVTAGAERRVTISGGGGRLARYRELARHHNMTAAVRRAHLTAVRSKRRIVCRRPASMM